jgi:glycine betaine/proline transport system permease protein
MSVDAATTVLAESVDGVPRIPLARWIESTFDWITNTFGELLSWVSGVVDGAVEGLITLLMWPAPLVVAVLFALLAWLVRDWKLGLGTLVGMALIISFEQWENAMNTLALIVFATVVALVIAIPLGIAAARWDRVSGVVRPVMDLMQTMPAMVWLIPAVTLFSIGIPAGLVATVIFALPPGARLTELGIRQVDHEVVEAAQAFGATPGQTLREVQLPLAMPTIMAGVNQVIMLSLSMAVLAGFVGAEGLGGAVVSAITQIRIGIGFEAGLSVVILAIFLDRVTATAGTSTPGQGRMSRLVARLPRGGAAPSSSDQEPADAAA